MERMKPIRFSDNPLRWVSALPIWPDGVHYDGAVFDFAGHRKEIEADLTRQITEGVFNASVLREHMPRGSSFGQVMAWRILTQDEAAAMGIRQQAPEELYFGLDIRDPEMAAEYDAGLLVFGSPEIRGTVISGEPWIDETGEAWNFFVPEWSGVSTPHNKRQTAAHTLRGVQMKDKKKIRMADGAVSEIAAEEPLPEGATMMDGEMEEVSEEVISLPAIMAELKALRAELAAAKAAPAAPMTDGAAAVPPVTTPPAVAPAAAAPPAAPMGNTPPAQMSDVNRRLAALESKEAAAEVDRLIAERDIKGVTRDKLVHLRMSDRPTFDAIAANAPKRMGGAARSAQAGVAMSDAEAIGTREGVDMLKARHTKDGKFDAVGYQREWRERRGRVAFSPVDQGGY
jgi:hypothetical protein